MKSLEKLKFEKGLISVIIQDAENGAILMLAYMNKDSLAKTLETGKTHFWSRSRNKIWLKGETSGHYQKVKEVYLDCDKDSLLIKVKQIKAACHKGYKSCFYRRLSRDGQSTRIVGKKIFQPAKVYKR